MDSKALFGAMLDPGFKSRDKRLRADDNHIGLAFNFLPRKVSAKRRPIPTNPKSLVDDPNRMRIERNDRIH